MQIDEEYFNNDEFRENLKSYEESVKSGHPIFLDADDLTDIIDYYSMQHNDALAESTADHALTLFPDAPGPITYKGRRCLDQDDIEGAEELVERLSNDDIDYKFIKAEIFLAQGKSAEAERMLYAALDAADYDDYDNCILDATNLFVDYKYYEKAESWLNKIEETDNDDYVELKVKICSWFGEIEEAEELLNKIIDRNPYQHKYWNMLSSAQLMNNKTAEALTSSEYSLAVTPDNPEGLICKAQVLAKMYQYDQAIIYYLKYLDIYNKDSSGYVQLATCFMSLGKNQEALIACKMAERFAEGDNELLGSIYENMALAYSHLHDETNAMACLKKLGNRFSVHQIDLMKAYIYLECGNKENGFVTLLDMLEHCDFDSAYVLKASVALFENEMEEAAYDVMRKFFPLDDDDMEYGHAYFALYCYNLGKDEEFLKYLKIATERNPEEAELTMHHIFPEGMKPSDYYNYIKNNNNNHT